MFNTLRCWRLSHNVGVFDQYSRGEKPEHKEQRRGFFPSSASSQLLLNRSTRRQTATIPPTANYAQNAAATLSIPPSGSNPLSSFYPTAALRTLTLNAIGQRSRCVFGSVSQNPSEASDDILTFSVNSFYPFHVYRARLKGFGQVW